MADGVVAQPGDSPNSIRSQYIWAMREVKRQLRAGRIDEKLRAFAEHEEAARIAAENPAKYVEILTEIRNENDNNGL